MSAFDWAGLDRGFRRATDLPGVDPDGQDWWDHWHRHLATRTAPEWFYTPENAAQWFGAHWPALTRRWLHVAESLLEDLVHAEDFRPGRLADGEIDWSANPTKSMSWSGFHYWSWANPWIRAYGLTGDERYAAEFSRHLRSYFDQVDTLTPTLWDGADPDSRDWPDWVTHNDLSAGVKMATMGEAVMVFRRADSWQVDDLRRATLILLRLASRLYDTYKSATSDAEFLRTKNFLTSGASGLGTVAAIFPECSWSTGWADLARRILEVHLTELYYADGGHKELCTQYHKTGIRDILFLERILESGGGGYFLEREPYRSHLLTILKWLAAILMPDGTTSVLNSAAASNDWLVFFIAANRQLQDPEIAWHIQRWFSPEYIPRQKPIPALCSRILASGDGSDGASVAPLKPILSTLLPDSGVAVLRDGWDCWANAMVLDFGRPVGGHAYPALASFSLYLGGKPAALSPGSPQAYTDPDYRGWMDTTRSQNTVLIDDIDQERWEAQGQRRVHGEILQWQTDADTSMVQGRHPGYLGNAGIIHTRAVLMQSGRFFLVYDVLDASKSTDDHVAAWSIHCPERLERGDPEKGTCGVTAAGLMRIVPAWPDRITSIDFGAEGKAVYPEDSADGTRGTCRQLHHARWRSTVAAGGTGEYLMLIQPDSGTADIRSTSIDEACLRVEISDGGIVDVATLPLAPPMIHQ